MTPTEANRPEHKAGGLLDRKDDRAPVDMSKPPCIRFESHVINKEGKEIASMDRLSKEG